MNFLKKLSKSEQRELVSRFLMVYSHWMWKEENLQTKIRVINYKGIEYGMDYRTASKLAASFMMEDSVKARKLEQFLELLQNRALTNIYEHLMGESIERAVK